ncbi:MAG: hypothetical protein AAF711_05335 [Planctomycetota bacterium]
MPETNPTDHARRRELLDALGKTSEMHYHELLVIAVLLGAQGIAAATKLNNGLIILSMVFTVIALGAQLWFYHGQVASVRLRLRPLLEGDDPAPDVKTRQELDWLTQQDPWLDRVSVWGLWLGAAIFVGGCAV